MRRIERRLAGDGFEFLRQISDAKTRPFSDRPSSGDSSPRIILNSVVLPVPLGPTRPTRVCGRRCADAPSNNTLVENCL